MEKKIKEKGYMLLFWGTNLSKKVFKSKKDALREREEEIEPSHCGSCDCGMEKSEIRVVEVEISFSLPIAKKK